MEEYTPKVMQYIKDPKNMGVIKDADGVGTVGNPTCGDVMKVYIKVAKRPCKSQIPKNKLQINSKSQISNSKPYEEYIEDIKVQTLGCGAAIATSSIITEMIKGKSLDEALKVSNKDVVNALGGLPKVKYHCSILAEEGIRKAIEDYRSRMNNK